MVSKMNGTEQKMTPAQQKVYDAVIATITRIGKDYAAQGEIGVALGKLPHPNTLQKLVKLGRLERDPNASWAAYRPTTEKAA